MTHYREILDGMGKTQYGKALQEYLIEEKAKLNNVKTVTSLDDALGRAHALDIIDRLFLFLQDKKVDNVSRNQYN